MTKKDLLDILYPPRCPVCDRVLPPGQRGTVCENCCGYGRPRRVEDSFCLRCGKPLEDSRQEYCRDCRLHPPVFTQGRAAFWYRGMEASMHRFKNRGRQEYAQFYGDALAQVLARVQPRWHVQVLVPIPIHRSRMRQRGYNQAALLCRELSQRTGIPVREDMLFRGRKTGYQRALNDEDRRENVKDAFCTGLDTIKAVTDVRVSYTSTDRRPYRQWYDQARGSEGELAQRSAGQERKCGQLPERILLVDDIYTTGSTMNEAARTLLAAGAEQVYALSVCIGKGY